MGKEVKITLKQLKRFLDQPYHNKFMMLKSAQEPLNDAFEQEIFTNPDDTRKISSKRELQTLIAKGRRTHKPAKPEKGAKYSERYLKTKGNMGITQPHIFENFGFLHGTEIYFTGDKVTMKTTPIIQRGTNYLALHETKRSVIKLTFLRAWQRIIDRMIDALKKEASKP